MKDNRKALIIIILFVGVMALLLVSTYLYINDSSNKKENTQISAVVYGGDGDRWANLRQGIDQGAADLGYKVNFVTMASTKDADEQISLIHREVANGADGLIIAAVDSREMAEMVGEISLAIPVTMIETNVDRINGLSYISADNYSMGLNIGRSIILNSQKKNKKVAILLENHHRNSVQERYNGFMDSLQYSDFSIDLWERDERGEDLSLFIRDRMTEQRADIIVAFDNNTLETVVDSMTTYGFSADIYGVGSTNKVIHYLDYGLIKAIAYQNEFNMGYLSVQKLFNHGDNEVGDLDTEIEFRTINRDTMYLPENQRLIFPIIQ